MLNPPIVLHHCNVFSVAESLTMVDGLNVDAYVAELDLEGKGITKIHPLTEIGFKMMISCFSRVLEFS